MHPRPGVPKWLRARLRLPLLELTIGVVLLIAVGLYVATALGTDPSGRVVGLELRRTMRVATDTIERDIRRAGFMVPASGAICAVDNLAAPDLLYLSDAGVLDPEHGATGHDNGASLAGDNVSGGINPAWPVELVLDATATYDNDGDGVADADFARGAGVIVTDRNAPERGSACGTVVDVDIARRTIRVEIRSSILAPGLDADLVAIPAHEYRIEAKEVLSRDGAELVRGTADLQVAFFVDANHDNIEQVGELIGFGAGPRYISGQVDLSAAREIRVHTVLLTRRGAEDGRVEIRRRTHTTRELLRHLVLR
jgi:hypothetical protein